MRPSLWDQLIVPYRGTPLYDYASPDAIHARLLERTSLFAAASASSATNAGPRLEQHYEYRCRCWEYLASSPLRDEDFQRNTFSLSRVGEAAALSGVVWIPIFFLWAAAKRSCGLGTINRLNRAFDAGHCPDCRYDLRSQRNGVSVKARIVTAQCPECGAAWPLLPPGLAYAVKGIQRPI